MKRFSRQLSFAFAFALIVSTASIGLAADLSSTIKNPTYKADLSGLKMPPVPTRATGQATFKVEMPGMTHGGAGTGGVPSGEFDTGMAGPGQGYGQAGPGGLGQTSNPEPYSGINKSTEPGGIGGAGAGGTAMGEALRYDLNVKDIKGVTAAHLHMGKSTDTEGPVVAPLYLGPMKSGKFSGVLAQGTITNKDLTGPLAGKTVADLVNLINSGDVYVNVHTDKHPAGEIRGEVKPVS